MDGYLCGHDPYGKNRREGRVTTDPSDGPFNEQETPKEDGDPTEVNPSGQEYLTRFSTSEGSSRRRCLRKG